VNRQVVETVDYPVIVTDNSVRGVNTAFMINEIMEKIPGMKPSGRASSSTG
jgi:CO dehydrogenase nickel-insertion accessory protein CooC1